MIKNIDVIFRKPYNYCNLRKIIYHQYLPMLIDIFDPMRAQTDRLRCEVCQNLILSPMNTGLLRHAVATVLTVYGIETQFRCIQSFFILNLCCNSAYRLRYWNIVSPFQISTGFVPLQQCLPFTVLKLNCIAASLPENFLYVATVLTVYGIETVFNTSHYLTSS